MFKVELLPALHGDCILIEYGSDDETHRVLIDGGPPATWNDQLRQRLDGLGKGDIELFVLTHVDADHIGGAIPALEQAPEGLFGEVWFNGWKHLLPSGMLSARQGEIFSMLIDDRGEDWNKAFGGKAVCLTEHGAPVKPLPGGMKLTILSPTPRELSRLKKTWSQQLAKHGLTPGAHHEYRQFLARAPHPSTDAEELAATAFRSDRSAPNASSIAFLAEYDGKRVLFTGDAYATVLARTISRYLEDNPDEGERLRIDVLKVPHHGSRGNLNLKLLKLLDCKQFWFSSNGDIHNLPDNEAVGRILFSAKDHVDLVFNYDCERTAHWGETNLTKQNDYTPHYGHDGHVEIDVATGEVRGVKPGG